MLTLFPPFLPNILSLFPRSTERGPERPREAQRGPEAPQRGPKRPRGTSERPRGTQRGPEALQSFFFSLKAPRNRERTQRGPEAAQRHLTEAGPQRQTLFIPQASRSQRHQRDFQAGIVIAFQPSESPSYNSWWRWILRHRGATTRAQTLFPGKASY